MPQNKKAGEPGYYPEALCKTGPSAFQSTFSTLSFITVGDKYGNKNKFGGTRFAGKQLATSWPKRGSFGEAFFTKEYKAMGGHYDDTQPQRYLKTQPRETRKQGFFSGDASKRDEIMNNTMSVIMAQTIKKEERVQKLAEEKARQEHEKYGFLTQDTLDSLANKEENTTRRRRKGSRRSKSAPIVIDDIYNEGRSGPEFLFDIGRGAETTFCPRSKRERWYEPHIHACRTTWSQGDRVVQGVDKNLGSTAINISSRDIGVGARELQVRTGRLNAPVEFEASAHSRRSVLQQQLIRNCGALLPPFTRNSISCAGPPGSTLLL